MTRPQTARPEASSLASGRAPASLPLRGGPSRRRSDGAQREGADVECDYAACSTRAIDHADGWAFCAAHLQQHNALEHGAPWPKSTPGVPREFVLQPCGTPAAYRRHLRHGERCETCLSAATRRQNGYTSPMNRRRAAS